VTGSCSKPEKDIEEGDIDEYLNTLEQDDPILIEAIKNYYLDKGNPNFPPVIPHDRLTDRRLAVSYPGLGLRFLFAIASPDKGLLGHRHFIIFVSKKNTALFSPSCIA
jgi:hypothetical protein